MERVDGTIVVCKANAAGSLFGEIFSPAALDLSHKGQDRASLLLRQKDAATGLAHGCQSGHNRLEVTLESHRTCDKLNTTINR